MKKITKIKVLDNDNFGSYETRPDNIIYRKVDKCFWCGAYLPRCIKFQEYHMEHEHGLVV